jgi:hypothetical protein
MRAVGVLVAAAVVAVGLLAPAGAGSPKPRAQLAVVGVAPVTVRGTGFRAREALRLRLVLAEKPIEKRVRTGPLGGFVTSFEGIVLVDRCSTSMYLSALGPNGVRAVAKTPPLACPPRLRPPSP